MQFSCSPSRCHEIRHDPPRVCLLLAESDRELRRRGPQAQSRSSPSACGWLSVPARPHIWAEAYFGYRPTASARIGDRVEGQRQASMRDKLDDEPTNEHPLRVGAADRSGDSRAGRCRWSSPDVESWTEAQDYRWASEEVYCVPALVAFAVERLAGVRVAVGDAAVGLDTRVRETDPNPWASPRRTPLTHRAPHFNRSRNDWPTGWRFGTFPSDLQYPTQRGPIPRRRDVRRDRARARQGRRCITGLVAHHGRLETHPARSTSADVPRRQSLTSEIVVVESWHGK